MRRKMHVAVKQKTFEKIRLPMKVQGQNVWRTLEEYFLVGISDGQGIPQIGTLDSDTSRSDAYMWFVIQAKSGKLVVYQQ